MSNPLPRFPDTASELNQWIKMNFTAFEGPARACFELPIQVALPGIGQVTLHKRVVYNVLSLEGPERDVVQHIAHVLRSIAGPDPDAQVPIFIRRWFEYDDIAIEPTREFDLSAAASDTPRRKVYGRLAFWNDNYNALLRASLPFTPEGYPAKSF